MAQSLDSEILDYLSLPENYALTLEIASYAVSLRPRVMARFDKALENAIKAKRPNGDNIDELLIQPVVRETSQYAILGALTKTATRQREHLSHVIESYIAAEECYICLGLCWKSPIQPEDPLYAVPAVSALRDRLVGADGYNPESKGWVCYRYIHEFDSPDEFLLSYCSDPAAILDPLVTAFWNLVTDTEAEVAEINKLLASR